MRTLVTALIGLAFLALLAGMLGPGYMDSAHGTDVILLVSTNDADQIDLARFDYEEELELAEWSDEERRDAVVSIYGQNPKPEVLRVLFVDEQHVIRPEEDPSLVLYPREVDGAYAVQAKSLGNVGKYVRIGAGLALVVLIALRQFVFKPRAVASVP